MDDITKKLVEAVNKITDKKPKLPSTEEIKKLYDAASDRYKNTKDKSHLPDWFVVRGEITESEAFGSGPPSIIPPVTTPKTPREMTDNELKQATAFGSNGSSEQYKKELRLRYGPSMTPPPPETPESRPKPKLPAYLEGQTDTVRFPELHLVYGFPKPPV